MDKNTDFDDQSDSNLRENGFHRVKRPGSLVEEFGGHFGVNSGGVRGKYRVEMGRGSSRGAEDESVVVNGYVGGFDERDMIERLRMRGRDGSGRGGVELEVGENVFGNRL